MKCVQSRFAPDDKRNDGKEGESDVFGACWVGFKKDDNTHVLDRQANIARALGIS